MMFLASDDLLFVQMATYDVFLSIEQSLTSSTHDNGGHMPHPLALHH